MFIISYSDTAGKNFSKLDKSEQIQILKKIEKLKTLGEGRHLKRSLPYFVQETGQYRICYKEIGNMRRIEFIGKHKEYEEWLQKQEFD